MQMKDQIQLLKTITSSRGARSRSPWRGGYFLVPVALALACLSLAPGARADCREGCDSLTANTFLGESALGSDTNGSDDTGIGFGSLNSNTTGVDNTGVGFGTLSFNTTGFGNNAFGVDALFDNTTGSYNVAVGHWALFNSTTSSNNTAVGSMSLYSNTTGSNNTTSGYETLYNNTTGGSNTASGYESLYSNTTGSNNTANGRGALYYNTSASGNTATGYQSLHGNKTASQNTATGYQALFKSTGAGNTANGYQALYSDTTGHSSTALGYDALYSDTTGANNTAIGDDAGFALTTGSNNIDIGNPATTSDANTIRIGSLTQTNTYVAGISGVTVASGVGVIVDSSGHLGTATSSARYKDNIQPMDKASEALLSLQPVTFRYKHELDPDGIPQFGLVAEQVEKVNPDLVARDDQGKPYTVRYEAVNAMLLNEFLKAHRKIEEQALINQKQEATIAQQKTDFERAIAQQKQQIQALTTSLKEQAAQLQKVSNEVDLIKPTPRVVTNR